MDTGNRIEVLVDVADDGARLDSFLAKSVENLSRSRAKALILAGKVAANDTPAREARQAVAAGDRIVVTIPPAAPAEPAGEPIALDVVFEDDNLLVVNKPPGLVVHPAAGHWSGTLVNALIAHCGESLSGIGGVARPGIVHRLDKDTSGLMVVAKNDAAHNGLAAQFADHGREGPLERAYLALAWGAPKRKSGTIDAAIGRAGQNREKMEIKKRGGSSGRHAVTHYAVRDTFAGGDSPASASLIECRLETGRTHQIRVHLASIGHPVVGDRTYGAGFATKANLLPEPQKSLVSGFPRQALHAYLLGFAHPITGETMRFERPPPADMAALIETFETL